MKISLKLYQNQNKYFDPLGKMLLHYRQTDWNFFFVMQVIEEIEEMMQESPDPDDDESPSQSDLSMLSQDLNALKRSASNTSYEDRK